MSSKILFSICVVLVLRNGVYAPPHACVPNKVNQIKDPTLNEFASTNSPVCTPIQKDKIYHYKKNYIQSVHLATTCVPEMFCGGEITGWVKGEHPKNNKKKDAVICVNRYGNCCQKKYDVEIYNCHGKYYYKYKDNINCQPKIRICTSTEQVYETTPCDCNPCKNGGTCIIRPRNNYTCQCQSQYTGFNCESDGSSSSDPCNPNPCKNGGTCSSSGGPFTCNCGFSFWGTLCESSDQSATTQAATTETATTEAATTQAATTQAATTQAATTQAATTQAATTQAATSEETTEAATTEETTTEETTTEAAVSSSVSSSASSSETSSLNLNIFTSTSSIPTADPSAFSSFPSQAWAGSSSPNVGSSADNSPSSTQLASSPTQPTSDASLSATLSATTTSNLQLTNTNSNISSSIETVSDTPSTGMQPTPSATLSQTGTPSASATASDGSTTNIPTISLPGTTLTPNTATFTPGLSTVASSSATNALTPATAAPTSERVDGGFGEWSMWGSCTKSCGTGNNTRTRTCTNPAPANNGSTCNGSYTDTQECNTQPCPIDGGWTEWTSWSYCNKPCGTGSSKSTRSCSNPTPMYGGQPCAGLEKEELPCNSYPCVAVMMQYILRFTNEEFDADLKNKTSSKWSEMEDKISSNANKSSTINSNVFHTQVISHREGSVISTFNLSYSSIDSIQVVQLLENIKWNGLFGDLPSQVLAVTPDVVPINPPTITYVSNSSSTSILIKWIQVSDVNVTGYAIFYKEEGTKFLPENVQTTPAADQQMDVSGLKKYTKYSLVLLAFSSKGNGIPSVFVNASTDEDVPSKPPGNFKVVTLSSTSLLITWKAIAQEYVHGVLLGYNVTFIKHGLGTQRVPMYKFIEPRTHTLTLEDLGKFTTFTISVCGFTSKGCGVATSPITAQTAEDVPSMPPQNFQAINLTSENSITLSWDQLPPNHINGILVGYVIRYQQTSSKDVKVKTSAIQTRYIAPGTRNIVFHGLPHYSVWKFQISAITNAGEGVPSNFTYGASCRCPKILYSNFFALPPYLTINNDGSFDGVFYNITEQMIKWACGNCKNGHGLTDISMKSNGKGGDAYKKGVIDLVNDIDDIPHISFPIYGNKYMNKYMAMYEYIHLMDSPGVTFITIDDPSETTGQRIINSVFGCIPLLLVAVLMALLAGFVVWVLEFRSNPEQFSPSFFSGFWDGFWWAYVSMTTVGYGDRFTVSEAGKVFSIVWTLTGIVIISMLTGSIATALTSETVQQDIMLYGAKVAAIHNSTEYRLGILKNAKVNTEKKYNNFDELKQALKARKVQGILLDMYVAAENQKIIFDSEIRIKKVLEKKFGYGVVLSGASAVVNERCRDFIKKNIADITKLIERKTKTIEPTEEKASEGEEEITMFDSESEMFLGFLMFSCAFLACACILGFIYHFGCYLPKQRAIPSVTVGNVDKITINSELYKDELLEEMRKMVEEFYQTQITKLEHMKKRYKQEITQILRKEKSISKKRNFFRIGKEDILFCLKKQNRVQGLSFRKKP